MDTGLELEMALELPDIWPGKKKSGRSSFFGMTEINRHFFTERTY